MNGWLSARATFASALVLLAILAGPARASGVTAEEARSIARDAYIFGYPLVENYRIQHAYFVDEGGPQYKGPFNRVISIARLYTPQDTAVQTPNSDTPYSFIGADLRTEPLVLTVPEIDAGRYYSLQFIDAYTFNFHYVGSRTTGNGGGRYLLAGPGWMGETPEGIDEVIRSETEFALIIYRTQLFGADDLEKVKTIQAGYTAQPLSEFLGTPRATTAEGSLPEPKVATRPVPMDQTPTQALKPLGVQDVRTDPAFFEILNLTLKFGPVPEEEKALRARMAKLGIGTEAGFDPAALPPDILAAVKAGMADAWDAFEAFKASDIDTGKVTSADCFGTREEIGGNWMYRMTAVVLGIYGNSAAEAFYPLLQADSEGKPLSGANAYTLTFAKGALPPVNAFWSVTMYDLPASLLAENPIDRYLINSPMLPDLKTDDDGGLTIYVQHDSPGAERESNWLPAPAGPFWMAMRLYWPKDAALSGEWSAPSVVRAD